MTARVSHPRLLAAAAAAIALLFILASDLLEPLENLSLDWRYQLRRASGDELSPVVVGIGDSAFTLAERAPTELTRNPILAQMSRPWPWDRRVFAAVVRTLRAAGARAIVFDVVFSAPNTGDADFASALAEPGAPVILAALFQDQHTAEGEGTVTFLEPRVELLASRQVSSGFANIATDRDGVVRQTWLTTSDESVLAGWSAPAHDEVQIPSLAAATVTVLGSRTLPERGHIDFRRPLDRFPQVPIENLFLRDRWEGALLDHGRLFRDRVVLVGPWSEIRFKDYHATPFGRMPGVELQAHVVTSLLGAGLLRVAPPAFTAAAVVTLTALAVLLSITLRRASWQAAGIALIGALWLTAASFAFVRLGWIVPLAAPLGALVATGGAAMTARTIGEQRERRRVRRLLASYVSEEVARVIVRQPDAFEIALRGERRPVTVLFADIRDFTSFAEQAAPEAFIAQLNEYLRPVVDCVLATGGTLQKFIGDAVLAVWGDTHTTGEAGDALRAVSAALAIEQAVVELNARWSGRTDRPPLRIGVGLHQGPAMVGNIGHPRRMEFAVLGDTVNLASRLEGANRFFGTTILVGETVHALAAEQFHFAPVAKIVVKGRQQAVAVFTPIGSRRDAAPAWLEPYRAAVAALDAGRFTVAAKIFATLPIDDVRFGALFASQTEFARQLALAPPPAWDGTRRFDKK